MSRTERGVGDEVREMCGFVKSDRLFQECWLLLSVK